MKKLLIIILISICIKGKAQKDLCFVTFLSGSIKKSSGAQLVAGDTIYYSSLSSLQIAQAGKAVFFNGQYGSFTLDTASIKILQLKDSYATAAERESHFKEGVKEFFRLKASRVKLSSRSADCACTVMEDCIKTDPEINDKLLVTDSLVLPAESVDESIRIIYILQWKHANTIYNNKLQIVNNKVVITRSDLMFNGVEYDENESPVKLGLQKFKGSAKSLSLISTIKLHFITSGELTDYYARLRSAMPGKTEKELFERFCQELYIFYGKPDVCKLKSIVHYTD